MTTMPGSRAIPARSVNGDQGAGWGLKRVVNIDISLAKAFASFLCVSGFFFFKFQRSTLNSLGSLLRPPPPRPSRRDDPAKMGNSENKLNFEFSRKHR